MSQASPSSPTLAAPGFSISRLARLALKELRETLRDRRTIITLVLMPILVYPVLSVALRQFLVSSAAQAKQVPLEIRTNTQEELLALAVMLDRGDRLIQEHESGATSTPLSGGPILGAALGASELPLSENHIAALPEGSPTSLEDLVRGNVIDLGVRLMPNENPEQARVESRFQLIYRPNMPLSRQAADFVERRLRAVNEQDLRRRLAKAGDRMPMRVGWRLVPVADEKGHSFWLGALVPLILILMTITGAVYPAIDLTAGERERGTLEALMAAPVPRLGLLMAKYVAVVTVATMTAVINLTAMVVTLASSGKELWTFFFGNQGSPAEAIFAILLLLILFAMFFSAVLLLVTSFARSFKEAQAYVVPLMVVALAPGFMSVMPGLELNWLMSVVPLANIVLLARDVLEGDAPVMWGAVAVFSTVIYGGLALALAARVFGSDAILYGSEGSWSDLFRRPRDLLPQATISGALTALALVMPLFIIVSGLHGTMRSMDMATQLAAGCGISLLLFVFLPVGLASLQGVDLRAGFQLRMAPVPAFVGAALLGCGLAPIIIELILVSRQVGLTLISEQQLAEYSHQIKEVINIWRTLSPVAILVALAVVPAVSEELFFRGYLLGALRGRLPGWAAIVATGILFGLFHASLGGVIMLDRVLPSSLLGIVLGWVCWQARSAWPGMLLHLLNNSLLLSLAYWEDRVKGLGLNASGESHVPLLWLVGAGVLTAAGLVMVHSGRSRYCSNSTIAEPLLESSVTEGSHASERIPG